MQMGSTEKTAREIALMRRSMEIVAIEPGVYFPKLGGIRIEDLVYVKNGRCKKFINVPANLESNII
jgi:Xaa-Pro aminopeptidase